MLRRSLLLLSVVASIGGAQEIKPMSMPDIKHRTCRYEKVSGPGTDSVGTELYTFKSPRHWMMISYDTAGTARTLTEGIVSYPAKGDTVTDVRTIVFRGQTGMGFYKRLLNGASDASPPTPMTQLEIDKGGAIAMWLWVNRCR